MRGLSTSRRGGFFPGARKSLAARLRVGGKGPERTGSVAGAAGPAEAKRSMGRASESWAVRGTLPQGAGARLDPDPGSGEHVRPKEARICGLSL